MAGLGPLEVVEVRQVGDGEAGEGGLLVDEDEGEAFGPLGVLAAVEDPEGHAGGLVLPVEEADEAVEVGGVEVGGRVGGVGGGADGLVEGLDSELVGVVEEGWLVRLFGAQI